MTTKICTKCGETKDVSEFNTYKKSKDRLSYFCTKCINQDSRHRSREYVKRHTEEWYSSDQAPKILTCSECGDNMPPDKFYRNMDHARGFDYVCMECKSNLCRARPAHEKSWKITVQVANSHGIELKTTRDEFKALYNSETCGYCGTTLQKYLAMRTKILASDASRYIKLRFQIKTMKPLIVNGDVVMCCGYCKYMRSGRSHEAWAAVAKAEVARLL